MRITLTAFTDGAPPIQGIKTLRQVAWGDFYSDNGLRWAKMEVFDHVRAGEPVDVNVVNEFDVAALESVGWVVTKSESAEVVFEDAELAVTYDSLCHMRDFIRENRPDLPTTNLDSALEKLNSLITPATYGLRITALRHN